MPFSIRLTRSSLLVVLCLFLLIEQSWGLNDTTANNNTLALSSENGEESSASGAAEHQEEPDWHLLRVGKITMICLIFFGTLGASILPWWFHRSKWAMMTINLGCCLAAGIIVGLAFSHMFGEAQKAFEGYFAIVGPIGIMRDQDVEYPFGALIAGSTLFLLLLLDNVVTAHAHIHGHSHSHSHAHGSTLDIVVDKQLLHAEVQTDERELCCCNCPGPSGTCKDINVTDMRRTVFGGKDVNEMCMEPEVCPPMLCSNRSPSPCCSPCSSSVDPSKLSSAQAQAAVVVPTHEALPPAIEAFQPTDEKQHKAPVAGSLGAMERGTRDQITRAWIFCAALSLHSLFDGLSVGAEQETRAFVAFIIAVISHKFFDGFVVGVALYMGHLPFWHTAAGLVFCAAMTPLGIGIGWAATSATEGAGLLLTRGFIFSISMGTFVFIALIELIPQGLEDGKWRPLKCILALIGFGIMALIALWV